MTTTEQASWQEVGDRLRALALKLQLHAEEESADGETVGTGSANGAFDRFVEGLRQAVDAVTDVVKDPAVQADVREAGVAFADAVHNTLASRRTAP